MLRSQLDTSLNAARCYVEQTGESEIETKLVWDRDFLVIKVAVRSNAQVGGRSLAGFAGLNSAGGTDVNLLSSTGRGFCDGPIPRSGVRMCVCVHVCA